MAVGVIEAHYSVIFLHSRCFRGRANKCVLITARQRSCGKAMFSYVSVYQSVNQSVCPQGGLHVTITHDALNLTVQPPTSNMGTPLLETSGDHHWRIVKTCSLEDPHQYWHLVATEACTVGKQAVCILLGCFLVQPYLSKTSKFGKNRSR